MYNKVEINQTKVVMQFVEQYLKKHHLLHRPHKWFLALLVSPIHLAEIHYKKRYHMQFAHARKLFIFDMLLLLSSLVIFSCLLFWRFYNPTVTNLVYLSIQKEPTRVLSGERMDFDIVYKNQSQVTLVSPKLYLSLPAGYILEKTEPEENFDKTDSTFILDDLNPNDAGTIHVFGKIYDTPNTDTHISTSLTYKQNGKKLEEKKSSPYIAVLRGSVLKSTIVIEDTVLAKGSVPLTVELKNEGDEDLNNITLPFQLPNGVSIFNQKIQKGSFIYNYWKLDKLKPGETALLETFLNLDLDNRQSVLDLQLTPNININNKSIDQETWKKELKVIHPNLLITDHFENNTKNLQPGELTHLYLDLKNTGDVELENITLSIPVPDNIVDTQKFLTVNKFKKTNSIYSLNIDKNLKPGESTEIKIAIPIKNYPTGGTDLVLTLSPELNAKIKNLESTYKTSSQTEKINIGTSLSSSAEIRYYSIEGDQLGRGPLPPKVGTETKYWAIIQINNGTSRISNLQIKATLPSYVTWTGKSSVSIGNALNFDSNTRQINWSLDNLSANIKEGIYFELSITPDSSMLDTNPIILKNISISGHDNFINQDIYKSLGNLDNSLKTDTIGKAKGSIVTSF